jgi:hypothetical protein
MKAKAAMHATLATYPSIGMGHGPTFSWTDGSCPSFCGSSFSSCPTMFYSS